MWGKNEEGKRGRMKKNMARRNGDIINFIADNFGGWNVAYVRCKNCGFMWVACFADGTKISDLQCKKCGQQGNTEIIE